MRSSSFQSSPRRGTRSAQTTKGAADFLRAHDKMSALLPAVTRMAALQKDCSTILPAVFDTCSVLKFEADQLVLTVPNAALSAKLKQQLPKLQDNLVQRGWQVNAIRLKLQPRKIDEKSRKIKQLVLPSQAISSFDALSSSLENSPQNEPLKAAINAMLRHHRQAR
ncbi:DUF721 domain-containing protein [Noviherbaspirillum cavernae]|uniref:DUF721 domain-containing protein n=2 Tax=Noviherbaspirillum cavernae TaxID=2320862 RepID=A0A418X5M2_9BURK|nr:DUF721 domain-containing protein [Noviherbaspirillum cavernae]